MTKKDLHIINSLLDRTENLPDILHLRAAPIGYELTDEDKKMLLDTYQKLDDILKEVAAFINVKFPGRQDYIQPWNDIDFDTKIGGIKIATTNREHTKSAWKQGLLDLKSLIKSIKNEVTLLVDEEIESERNIIFNETEWNKYVDNRLEKRADQADFFIDMIVEKKLINLDKPAVRKYFKKWFKESQKFDLQIKNGDLVIEDNDIQIVPNFGKDNIPEFLKWFENEGNTFMDYLKNEGVNVDKNSKKIIINSGNMIINQKSKTGKQIINRETEQKKESIWTKANVLITLFVGIATILGVLWQIFS